ncbi:hypothetical protein [Teredinibacter sp. KSP-S5-2]|uniref:hypothetical protein n=1 Tax=Teredinibacter sp. KSP-S5-2 TaxID=3034506 RepID=UPI0029350F70|nr:hypothetical protein [Teredinibacter sp. KSP-S5-2]WNO10071.1 hypothetical protein P5V12_02685 [Teredinibacter sp. KSP-S5-2]
MNNVVEEYKFFKNINAVLDIARFPVNENATSTDPRLIINALEEFGNRYKAIFQKINPDLDIKEYFNIQIDYQSANGIKGREIEIHEFWGEGYDITNNTVNLFEYSKNCMSTSVDSGLAHALLDPPYCLKRPPSVPSKISIERKDPERKWMTDLVNRFNNEVLKIDVNSSLNHIIIEEWPTNWSNYFDAGNEWWGSFLWSVLDKKNKWVTVIGASTTD